MNPTFFPTQIGYTPTGSAYGSQVVIGRNLGSPWEAIGFGVQGRPDYVERVYINITQASGVTPARQATVALDVQSLLSIMAQRPLAPTTGFYFSFREYLVCDQGDTKAALFLSSQAYPTGTS
jgi:hypothetical protein